MFHPAQREAAHLLGHLELRNGIMITTADSQTMLTALLSKIRACCARREHSVTQVM